LIGCKIKYSVFEKLRIDKLLVEDLVVIACVGKELFVADLKSEFYKLVNHSKLIESI